MISDLFAVWCDLCTRISASGAKSVAPLCGYSETAVWCHCLRPKKADLCTFRRQENCFKYVIIYYSKFAKDHTIFVG